MLREDNPRPRSPCKFVARSKCTGQRFQDVQLETVAVWPHWACSRKANAEGQAAPRPQHGGSNSQSDTLWSHNNRLNLSASVSNSATSHLPVGTRSAAPLPYPQCSCQNRNVTVCNCNFRKVLSKYTFRTTATPCCIFAAARGAKTMSCRRGAMLKPGCTRKPQLEPPRSRLSASCCCRH